MNDAPAQLKVLVTGATGKTGRQLVALLRSAGIDHVAASRNPPDAPNAKTFDWTDPATHAPVLEGVTSLYVVSPSSDRDPAQRVIDFCEKALGGGVRRIVLLSASLLPEGGPYMGQVHAWLRKTAPEWAVLQPSWFMQNFLEPFAAPLIRDEGLIYSATGSGRVGFIDANDIAKSAFGALTSEIAPNRGFILTGPETLGYDDIAAKISRIAGHPVRHVSMPVKAYVEHLISFGFGQGAAQTLAGMDALIADGAEDRVTDGVLAASGMSPSSFDEFAQSARAAWVRA